MNNWECFLILNEGLVIQKTAKEIISDVLKTRHYMHGKMIPQDSFISREADVVLAKIRNHEPELYKRLMDRRMFAHHYLDVMKFLSKDHHEKIVSDMRTGLEKLKDTNTRIHRNVLDSLNTTIQPRKAI